MSSIKWQAVPVSLNAAGAGTAWTAQPVSGQVLEVSCQSTALTTGGSADITITRPDGGTVLAITNQAAGTWQYQPRASLHSVTGAAGTAVVQGIPCEGHLKVVVLQGALSAAGTINIFHTCD